MATRFTTWFELQVAHAYFGTAPLEGLHVVPTAATQQVFKNLRVVWKPRPLGLIAFLPLAEGGMPLVTYSEGLRLRFDLMASNQLIPTVTDFAPLTVREVLEGRQQVVYTNDPSAPDVLALQRNVVTPSHTDYLRVNEPAVNEAFFLQQRPASGVSTADFQVANLGGITQPSQYEATSNRLVIDTSAAAVGDVFQVTYPVIERKNERIGLVELSQPFPLIPPRVQIVEDVAGTATSPVLSEDVFGALTITLPQGGGTTAADVQAQASILGANSGFGLAIQGGGTDTLTSADVGSYLLTQSPGYEWTSSPNGLRVTHSSSLADAPVFHADVDSSVQIWRYYAILAAGDTNVVITDNDVARVGGPITFTPTALTAGTTSDAWEAQLLTSVEPSSVVRLESDQALAFRAAPYRDLMLTYTPTVQPTPIEIPQLPNPTPTQQGVVVLHMSN